MLEQLVSAAAGALVGAMTTDAWHVALSGFARLIGRGDARREELAKARLSRAAAELEQLAGPAREHVRQQVLRDWHLRLRDLVEEYPDSIEDLRVLSERVRLQLPPADQKWAQVNAAQGHGTVYAVQGGSQYIHHHAPGTAADELSEGG